MDQLDCWINSSSGSAVCQVDMYLASAPVWLQAAIFKPLAALGRALGYEKLSST